MANIVYFCGLMVHEAYMHRCLQLAALGKGNVAPNPMVGAVLVHNNKIIGEGYHQKYGEAHAEVNCISNVLPHLQHLICESTLYVSLEPCSHFGKTPPCVDLILKHKIPNVVIGCSDSFEKVNGKGIEKLKVNGVNVICTILENECIDLNKRFFTYHTKKRPYIILKWAQSKDGFIGKPNEKVFISNANCNKIVHKWRSEEAAILVGTNTATVDNPALTVRHWQGNNPIRILLDKNLNVAKTSNLYNNAAKTIVLNSLLEKNEHCIVYKKINDFSVQSIVDTLYQLQVQSVFVEGGAKVLQSFIDATIFDEIRIIKNENLFLNEGIAAPNFKPVNLQAIEKYANNTISYYSI
jgi:diaminohydroxyphosphoribosylaminopyrimidine deaminase / 5-amino-6-(5-phosphoribosylamino)uracil reductase